MDYVLINLNREGVSHQVNHEGANSMERGKLEEYSVLEDKSVRVPRRGGSSIWWGESTGNKASREQSTPSTVISHINRIIFDGMMRTKIILK